MRHFDPRPQIITQILCYWALFCVPYSWFTWFHATKVGTNLCNDPLKQCYAWLRAMSTVPWKSVCPWERICMVWLMTVSSVFRHFCEHFVRPSEWYSRTLPKYPWLDESGLVIQIERPLMASLWIPNCISGWTVGRVNLYLGSSTVIFSSKREEGAREHIVQLDHDGIMDGVERESGNAARASSLYCDLDR